MTLAAIYELLMYAKIGSYLYASNRVVSEIDRTFALGFKTCVVNLLGLIPAATLFGWIIDNYCIIWRENEDGTTGNCWAYDVENLVKCLLWARIFLTLSSAGLRFLAWWWYPEEAPAEEKEGLVGDHVKDVNGNEVDSPKDEHK